MNKRIAIIGNGSMTFDCIKILNESVGFDLLLVISDPNNTHPSLHKRLTEYCNNSSINYISTSNFNTEDTASTINEFDLDYIFNIDSFSIIKPLIFKLPKYGIVNFHNSPLPHYRGANAPSWAIINDEKQFGVTWHFIEESVDTGDVIWQTLFDVRENETARSLIMRCIEEGINLFRNNLPDLLNDSVRASKQIEGGKTYYRRDTPNNGYINFNWGARKIDCHVRGLDFRPFKNNFIDAKIKLGNLDLIVQKVSVIDRDQISSTCSPGTILDIAENGIEISCGDGAIRIENVSDLDGNAIKISSLDLNLSADNGIEILNVA